MTEQSKTIPKSWEEVIISFLRKKCDTYKKGVIKDALKLMRTEYKSDKSIEVINSFNPTKDFEDISSHFEALELLTEKPEKIPELVVDCLGKLTALEEKYTPSTWLEENSTKSKGITFATHVAKLTHSKSKGNSISDVIEQKLPNILSTSTLRNPVKDVVASKSYAPVYEFLQLHLNGELLIDQLVREGSNVLKTFAKDDIQLRSWNFNFKQSLNLKRPSSHLLNKQIYYNLDGDSYHLLSAVRSSSMAQELHERCKNNFPENKFITPSKKYLEVLKLGVTASEHGNASQLNGKRLGKIKLLSCQPPLWVDKISPPNKESFFNSNFARWGSNKICLDILASYIVGYEIAGLSHKNPKKYSADSTC